jgi:hypothetical protein
MKLKNKSGEIVNAQFSCGPLSDQDSGGSSYLMIGATVSNEDLD